MRRSRAATAKTGAAAEFEEKAAATRAQAEGAADFEEKAETSEAGRSSSRL